MTYFSVVKGVYVRHWHVSDIKYAFDQKC